MTENYIPQFKSHFKNELTNFIIYKRGNGYFYTKDTCQKTGCLYQNAEPR